MPKPLHYVPYIKPYLVPVPQVQARDGNPDEAFFVRTHFAMETWFAQLIDELIFARMLLSGRKSVLDPPIDKGDVSVEEDKIPVVTAHIRRATSIFRLLTQHFVQLETLTTASFFDFRRGLFTGSGFQSYRNREVEWLLGYDEKSLRDYVEGRKQIEEGFNQGPRRSPMPSEHEKQLASLEMYHRTAKRVRKAIDDDDEPLATRKALAARAKDIKTYDTLRYWVVQWLKRTPHPPRRKSQFKDTYDAKDGFRERWREAFLASVRSDLKQFADIGSAIDDPSAATEGAQERINHFLGAPERSAMIFISEYSARPLLAWPAALLDALLDLDQAIAEWRARHVAMVSHVLGSSRITTGGDTNSGLSYLQLSTYKRLFPELWDARSFFIGGNEARAVYDDKDLAEFGFQ